MLWLLWRFFGLELQSKSVPFCLKCYSGSGKWWRCVAFFRLECVSLSLWLFSVSFCCAINLCHCDFLPYCFFFVFFLSLSLSISLFRSLSVLVSFCLLILLPLVFVFLISIFGWLLRWCGDFLDILGHLTTPNPPLLVCFVLSDWMIFHMFLLPKTTFSAGEMVILWTSSSLFWASGVASLLVVVAVVCFMLLFSG